MFDVLRPATQPMVRTPARAAIRLTVLARDRNAPHKHVWRAEIVLLSADGVGINETMRLVNRRPRVARSIPFAREIAQ